MRPYIATLFASILCAGPLLGNAAGQPAESNETLPFKAFTGKVLRNKVRVRLQPSLESPILRELSKEDLLAVVGEADDFYAIEPPAGFKAYVFRTFILDDHVEGNRVNVRLEPDLDAPIIAQLNSGDKVEGIISQQNSKWLEIPPPASAKFYVSKEYVEKLGDPSLKKTLERRRKEVQEFLNTAEMASRSEMEKPFEEINMAAITENLNKIIQYYSDFPSQVSKAKDLLAQTQETYLRKKVDYLEGRSHLSQAWEAKNAELSEELDARQARINELENTTLTETAPINLAPMKKPRDFSLAEALKEENRFEAWQNREQTHFEAWEKEHEGATMADWYQEQMAQSQVLKGVIEAYPRGVKNKPGDYILINPDTRQTIAYLYSTRVNLQDKKGKQVTLYAAERPNNRFAFPAYYVLDVN